MAEASAYHSSFTQ